MDCVHILKYLNIFLTTFFTFLLAIFAFFQWRAVEKQNKQTLFNLRVEHHIRFNSSCIDIKILIERLKDVENKIFISKMKESLFQFEKIIPESEYLFNKELYEQEIIIVDEVRNLLKLFENKESLDDFDINISEKATNKISEITDKFLNQK